jgi:hypothetical protein
MKQNIQLSTLILLGFAIASLVFICMAIYHRTVTPYLYIAGFLNAVSIVGKAVIRRKGEQKCQKK